MLSSNYVRSNYFKVSADHLTDEQFDSMTQVKQALALEIDYRGNTGWRSNMSSAHRRRRERVDLLNLYNEQKWILEIPPEELFYRFPCVEFNPLLAFHEDHRAAEARRLLGYRLDRVEYDARVVYHSPDGQTKRAVPVKEQMRVSMTDSAKNSASHPGCMPQLGPFHVAWSGSKESWNPYSFYDFKCWHYRQHIKDGKVADRKQ